MAMRGITIKLSDATLRRLEHEARATGRSVAAIIRERIEARPETDDSVYGVTHDLAGSLSGKRKPATNDRRRFNRT
jgi:predicted transcriptional regulator